MYKFINPGSSGIKSAAKTEGARTTLLAINRLGSSVSGLSKTVNNLEKIYKASAKNEKLIEIAERRRAKRERDRQREEEIESQRLLDGKDLEKQAKDANSTKGKFGSKLKDSLLGGLEGILTSIVGFLMKLFALTELKKLQAWFNDPVAKEKRKEFVENFKYVFTTFLKWGKRLVVDGIAKPFNQLINGKTFGEKLQGLGKLVLGLSALTVLLNPFGTMDAILSMLGMDFYRDKTQRDKGKGKDNKGRTSPNKNKLYNKRINARKDLLTKQFGKNGRTAYDGFRAQGDSHAEALKKVKRLQRQRPDKFKPKVQPKTSGLSPSGAKPGISTKYGFNRSFGRGALKFMGKNNVKLLGKAFKNTFGKVPVFGTLLTAVFSRLQGDPWGATIFKTAGAAVGGGLGTWLLPGIGSWIGTMVGEYVGNLLYMGFKGDGWQAAGKKLKEDAAAFIGQVKNIFDWMKTRVTKFYKGIPKIKIPDFPKDPPNWIPPLGFGLREKIYGGAKIAMKAMLGPIGLLMGKEVPNIAWIMDGFGFKNTLPLLHKSFFKSDPVQEGSKTSGEAMVGKKSEEEEKAGDDTSGTKKLKPSPKKGQSYDTMPFVPAEKYKGVESDNERYGDTFPQGSFGTKPKKLSPYERKFGKKHNPLATVKNKGLFYETMPFIPMNQYKGVESDNERYGDTMPDGAFGIGSKSTDVVSRHSVGSSKDQPKTTAVGNKKKPWWKFGFQEGGHVPQFLFGFVKSIFKGVTKAVSSVVSTVGKVVSSVASVAMPILSVAAPFIPALAPIMPFMQAAQAVSAVASGNIMGAIAPGLGALGGFFPGTFGAESAFGQFMSNNPIGKAIGGFVTGGVQGALGGLTSFLPQGFQDFLGGIGGFMNKFPSIGGIISGIPGLGGILGSFGVTGLDGGGFSPMSLFGDIANQMGFGSLFNVVSGMIQGGGVNAVMDGLREMAPELGVRPEALGIFTAKGKNARNNLMSSQQSSQSKAYAMQSQLEFIPMPVIIEKMVPIHKAVPIGN
tara:strand:+ start:1999 stop:5028 length:3030 start_codon:yes stop_codon:yes gene_type:complete